MSLPGFPNSRTSNWRPTSEPTSEYNCLAHALYDNRHWIWPDPTGEYAWPPDLPRRDTVTDVLRFLALMDYHPCPNGTLEQGYHKIAIYADTSDRVTHFARQVSNGKWSSKMGDLLDLEHDSVEVIEKADWKVAKFVRRQWDGPPVLPTLHPPPARLITPDGRPLLE